MDKVMVQIEKQSEEARKICELTPPLNIKLHKAEKQNPLDNIVYTPIRAHTKEDSNQHYKENTNNVISITALKKREPVESPVSFFLSDDIALD